MTASLPWPLPHFSLPLSSMRSCFATWEPLVWLGMPSLCDVSLALQPKSYAGDTRPLNSASESHVRRTITKKNHHKVSCSFFSLLCTCILPPNILLGHRMCVCVSFLSSSFWQSGEKVKYLWNPSVPQTPGLNLDHRVNLFVPYDCHLGE